MSIVSHEPWVPVLRRKWFVVRCHLSSEPLSSANFSFCNHDCCRAIRRPLRRKSVVCLACRFFWIICWFGKWWFVLIMYSSLIRILIISPIVLVEWTQRHTFCKLLIDFYSLDIDYSLFTYQSNTTVLIPTYRQLIDLLTTMRLCWIVLPLIRFKSMLDYLSAKNVRETFSNMAAKPKLVWMS